MNRNDLFKAIEGASDKSLERSEKAAFHAFPAWFKFAIIACLCAAVGSAAIIILPKRKGVSDSIFDSLSPNIHYEGDGDGLPHELCVLELNGCYYEAVDIDWVLVKYGLPEKITVEEAGEHVSYLEKGDVGYIQSAVPTDAELYVYAPAPCQAVYVLRDDESYMAALLCNVIQPDDNSSCDLGQLYKFYGIERADDISSICETDWNRRRTIGEAVTDSVSISEFYDITTSLPCFGNRDFQAMTFDGTPEEQQPELNRKFADDNRVLCVEAASGLKLYLDCHPSFGWIYGGAALSYYQTNESFGIWFDRNIGK